MEPPWLELANEDHVLIPEPITVAGMRQGFDWPDLGQVPPRHWV